jgi:tetratricopeptide (TPR) repeat protein/tRNA A-37 threonylcarbamoyl transferase component Bud32
MSAPPDPRDTAPPGEDETRPQQSAAVTATHNVAQSPTAPPLGSGASRTGGAPLLAADVVLAGRFRVLRFVAKGGMGEVYEAEDLELREHVALKTVRAELAEDGLAMERFRREIQLARKVTHVNVCRTFDIAHDASGAGGDVTFVTMELLAGETLSSRLKRDMRMAPAQALPLVRQMAAGLNAAHEAGIVHRDFKSANVVLVPAKAGERAVITDFGLARPGGGDGASLTGTGMFAGTPEYIAPEQIEGGAVTPATDVYALGVLLFEMVTGVRPFVADTPLATAMKRLVAKPPAPRSIVPGLDPRWDATILRCLERDPADRFQSAPDVVSALAGEEVARGRRAQRRRKRVLQVAALAGVTLLAAIIGFQLQLTRRLERAERAAPPVVSRKAVAVLGFKNLVGRTDEAWISSALAETLRTEMGAGGKLRAVPGETVERVKVEQRIADADSLAPDTLARLRAGTSADVVVLGAYLAPGKDAGGEVRLDVKVQDTASGETLVSLSETGSEAGIVELVAKTGARLRETLGAGTLTAVEQTAARAALPSAGDATRLYAEGLAKLRLYDARAARELLERAVAADPNYPLARVALADAWAAQGYDAKAADEAKRAFERADNLSREDRLLVEGRYREAAKDWPKAIEVYRTLHGFFPDNLEYGLRLAAAESSSGKGKEAIETIEALRGFKPPASEDPRIDLAEAVAAEQLGDNKRIVAAAGRAGQKGEAQGSRQIVARARVLECSALQELGETLKATQAGEEARRIFAELGDRAGEGTALNRIAGVLWRTGDLPAARQRYDEALALAREVGDRKFTARALNNRALVVREQGELIDALKGFDEAREINVELGEQTGVSVALDNMGKVSYRLGRLAAARRAYDESLKISLATNYKTVQDDVYWGLGNCSYSEGHLADARASYQKAIDIARPTSHKRYLAFALDGLARVVAEQGDLSLARSTNEEALKIRDEMGEKLTAAESHLALAQLWIEEGRPNAAEAPARGAIDLFVESKASDKEAFAQVVLARALLAQAKPALAEKAIARAQALLPSVQHVPVRLAVALAAGDVAAASGKALDALRGLEDARAEALRVGFVPEQLEARLAIARIQLKTPQAAAARAALAVLAKEASASGFKRLEGHVRAALQ